MRRRVNPIILLSLILVLILSLGVLASARLEGGGGGGGSASDAIGVGTAQMGKPWQMSADGPSSFSCAGLIRYILRTIGVDSNAPMVPEAYLGTYAPVSLDNLQPGDVVIYPDWATMYLGGGMLLNSNQALGYVTETPMSDAGTPEGAVRPPYGAGGGGQSQSDTSQPQTDATNPLNALDPLAPQTGNGLDLPVQPAGNGLNPQSQQALQYAPDPMTQQASDSGDLQLQFDPTLQADPTQQVNTTQQVDPALQVDPTLSLPPQQMSDPAQALPQQVSDTTTQPLLPQ